MNMYFSWGEIGRPQHYRTEELALTVLHTCPLGGCFLSLLSHNYMLSGFKQDTFKSHGSESQKGVSQD